MIALFLLIGAGLSAVYYLPMAELAGQSVRPESGLSRAQAVAYSLPWPHLVTAISPFFFFDPKASGYWGAWNPAEMAFYVGPAHPDPGHDGPLAAAPRPSGPLPGSASAPWPSSWPSAT